MTEGPLVHSQTSHSSEVLREIQKTLQGFNVVDHTKVFMKINSKSSQKKICRGLTHFRGETNAVSLQRDDFAKFQELECLDFVKALS